jgi:hypothetical protein
VGVQIVLYDTNKGLAIPYYNAARISIRTRYRPNTSRRDFAECIGRMQAVEEG